MLILCFAFLVGSGLVLAGCSDKNDTTTPIQKPTTSDQNKQDLEQVLKELLPTGAKLLTAKDATQKESIRIEKTEDKEYAFVLYQDTKENQQAHILMLLNKDGWIKIADVSTGLISLDAFDVMDLDKNDTKELLVGGVTSDTETMKQLFIYEVSENGLEEKVNQIYEKIDISNYSDKDELYLLLLEGEINVKQTANLYQYQNGQLNLISELELNSEATHENIVFGKLADDTKALFIDSGVGAHSMLTEIVAFSQGKLVKVGEDFDGVLMKEYPLYSRDINGDGIIEVGGMYIPKGYEEAAMAEIPFIDTYNDYKIDGTKVTIEERYSDEGQHFYITIPKEWFGKVTVERQENEIRLVSTKDNKELFLVQWKSKDSQQVSGVILGETKDTVYYSSSKDALIIPSENFHLMETELN